jgi:hypothetical protein
MNTTRFRNQLLVIATMLLAGATGCGGDTTVIPGMAGHWDGNARVIVALCRQPNLPISLDIREDGSVTGKVGDATSTKGQLKSNRSWSGRELNLKTDYIITGDLNGSIVAAEEITVPV